MVVKGYEKGFERENSYIRALKGAFVAKSFRSTQRRRSIAVDFKHEYIAF